MVGATGEAKTLTAKVEAVPEPQEFTPETVTLPEVTPGKLAVIEFVPAPVKIVPLPGKVQLYDVAVAFVGTLKVAACPIHVADPVIVPIAVGKGFTVTFFAGELVPA
mgnify:CR=1 FL=1